MFRALRFLLFSFLLLQLSLAGAQKTSNDTSDVLAFYLSYTNPAFYLTSDSLIKARNFSKYYSLYSYLYSLAEAPNLTSSDLRTLDSLALYIRKRYVAEKLLQQQYKSITVSDREALAYYNSHLDDFTEPAVYSYYQIFVFSTEQSVLDKAKQSVLDLASRPDVEGVIKGDKNQLYSISYERSIKLSPEFPVTPYIKTLSVNQFSDLLDIKNFMSKVMYYVSDKTEGSIAPFEQVKQECINRKKAEEISKLEQMLYEKALKAYPLPR